MKTIAVNALYLTGAYPSSGFGRYLQSLLAELARLDKVNSYLLFSPEPVLEKLGERFENIVLSDKNVMNFSEAIAKSEVFLKRKPDLFFLPHAEFPSHFPNETKVIVTIHDIIPTLFLRPEYLFRGKTPFAMLSSRGLWEAWTFTKNFKKVWKIITVSETSKKDLIKVFGRDLEPKIKAIYNGVEPAFRIFSKEVCAESLNTFGLVYKSYLIYFGGHTVRKNLGRVIQAYANLPETMREQFPFVVIGEGYWKQWVLKRGLDKNVRFLPKLSLETLTRLVSGALLSVYPSLYEGFGLPILESLRAGTLPLVSETPASRELLGADFEMFDPYDRVAIQKMLFDRLSRAGQTDTNLKNIMKTIGDDLWKTFSWSKAAEGLIKLWDEGD